MSYPYGAPLQNLSGLSEFAGRDSVDLLARMIYSEAQGESWAGKQGVAWVAKNRKNNGYWGSTYEAVLLSPSQFEGMTTLSARQPTLGTTPWTDSLYIAQNVDSQYNPIGNRMYFLPYFPTGHKDIMKIGKHYFFNW